MSEKLIAAGTLMQIGQLGIGALFGLFLTLVLTPYFMISGPRLAAGAIWLIPPERRKSVTDLLPKIIPALRRYLLGIFLVVVYTSLIAWIGFGPVFALPGAVLLAVTVGVLELMPVIGLLLAVPTAVCIKIALEHYYAEPIRPEERQK